MILINEDQFKEKAKQTFDKKADSLDSQTLARLKMAREVALSQQAIKLDSISFFSTSNFKWLTGAGTGLALASVLSFMIVPGLMSSKNNQSNVAFLEDIELLSQDTELDLYTQLDFYEWLGDSFSEAEL